MRGREIQRELLRKGETDKEKEKNNKSIINANLHPFDFLASHLVVSMNLILLILGDSHVL